MILIGGLENRAEVGRFLARLYRPIGVWIARPIDFRIGRRGSTSESGAEDRPPRRALTPRS